jgi:hypothetical protein
MASIFDMLLAQVRRKVHKPIYMSPSRRYGMQHVVRQTEGKTKNVKQEIGKNTVASVEERVLADDCKIDVNETKYVNQQIWESQDICEIKQPVTERNERTTRDKSKNIDFFIIHFSQFNPLNHYIGSTSILLYIIACSLTSLLQ